MRGSGGRWLGALAVALAVAISAAVAAAPAHAARHALLVGVGKYDKKLGVDPVAPSANDVEALGGVLAQPGVNFKRVVLKDDQVADKAAFEAAFEKFLSNVRPGDEVVFYFSGHGLEISDRGNFFLLGNAKNQSVYLQGLQKQDPATARTLDTQEKRDRSYHDWIAQVALDEKAIEKAIMGRGASVLVILVDACRTYPVGTKGAGLVGNGIAMQRATGRGVFRLYSCSKGQVSIETPDRTGAGSGAKSTKGGAGAKDGPKLTSLFTRVLLNELQRAHPDISLLAAKVRIDVREQARRLLYEQVPDFKEDGEGTRFNFVEGTPDVNDQCLTATAEFERLRDSVMRGAIGREHLEGSRIELAPCGLADQIEDLMRFEALGVGAGAQAQAQTSVVPETGDPLQQCDLLASSPHDPNRLDARVPIELEKIALAAANSEDRSNAVAHIERAIKACETAVQERGRVARYKFNLARSYNALASIAAPGDRPTLLEKASRFYTEAGNLGYAAAYNALGLLYQNGEFHVAQGSRLMRTPPDRDKAVELFERGANLNDMLANYNLGMAYKNGENGVTPDRAKAFTHLSKAAETGFMPAKVQTALLLRCRPGRVPNPLGCGVNPDRKRAVEMLKDSALRGSVDAMFWLGEMYRLDFIDPSLPYTQDIITIDFNEAAIWYARAADAGDARSQERVADMLTKGDGLPTHQVEAAGRYWRLAAEGGNVPAQMRLADLIRDRKIPYRPPLKGDPDDGAHEIRGLYLSAFARGKPEAGLALARLYRTGFPADRGGSEAIPKSPEAAIDLLWEVMNRVRAAPSDSDEANPEHEVRAAFELMDIYEKGEHRRRDRMPAISEDQISQLRADFGDHSQFGYIDMEAAFGGTAINCADYRRLYLLVWNWSRPEPPTDLIFDWYERRYRCKDVPPGDKIKTKPEALGITKAVRDLFKREFEAARKDKAGTKTFVDRMRDLVSVDKSTKKR